MNDTPQTPLNNTTPREVAVDASKQPAPPEDILNLDAKARVDYILDVRRRIQADPTSVSDDEIRNSVRLIRESRAAAGTAKKSAKTAVPAVGLSDF